MENEIIVAKFEKTKKKYIHKQGSIYLVFVMDYTKISNNGTYQTSPLDDYDFLTTKDVINNEDLQNDILSILRKYKLDSENFSTNKRNVFKQYYKDFLQPSL